jgi:hypothetical protein
VGDSRLAESRQEARDLKERSNERIRILANWDPSYPDEKVRWYDEYIARNAPITTNWLQQPRKRESPQHEYLEIRGMGLYTEQGESESTLVVAPLDDGSLCIWDIAGTKGRKGSIIARSESGILFPNDVSAKPHGNPKLISAGVTECVSVDNIRKIAYIAVQNGEWEFYTWALFKTIWRILSSGCSHPERTAHWCHNRSKLQSDPNWEGPCILVVFSFHCDSAMATTRFTN